MSTRKPWPMWSKRLVLFLLIALGALLVSKVVGESVAGNAWMQALLNLIIAVLALLSAVAIAVGESIHGLNLNSDDRRERVASWVKISGHGALIASVAYLVALAWTTWQAASPT